LLAEYDNVLLSHSDRTRFSPDEHRARLSTATGPVQGSVLLDGFLRGTWFLERDPAAGRVTLVIRHVERLSKRATTELTLEGLRLVEFLGAGAEAGAAEIRFVPL